MRRAAFRPGKHSKEVTVDTSRRQILFTGGVLATAAAVGIGYWVWNQPRRPAAPSATGDVSMAELMRPGPLKEMALGEEKAPVTIVEYASMTCPHCAAFHQHTYPELKKRYIETGKVRFVFREFPLDQLALAAFMIARCAGDDKYFPMIETLFQQQQEWVTERPLQPLMAIAKQAGIGEQRFNECLKDEKLSDGIEAVRTRAVQAFNVQSTPTFFINGKLLRGAFSIQDLEKQIQPYLQGS
jgi:protein-disulfide isomerase